MNFRSIAVLFGAFLATACSAGPDTPDPNASAAEELSAREPIAFGLQFVGLYQNASAATGAVSSLELRRNGTYVAHVQGQTASERGAFVGPAHSGLPFVFRLITRSQSWTATVRAYDGALQVTRAGATSALTASRPVGPSESLCDESGGSWTDDDPDPATGLFCICAAPKVYIASAGGCVR